MNTDGTFESEWQDVTKEVKKYGTITKSIDVERLNKIRFNSIQVQFNNELGKFNPETEEGSLWYGYASQQRTLVRIETGFVEKFKTADGSWNRGLIPGSVWGVSHWDDDLWDSGASIYQGIVSGDIYLSSRNTVSLPIMPLQEVFRQFPANLLTGFTSTGMTASQFIQLLRDQTDGSANFLFRPFFGDTTTNWNIETTTQVYSQLNTSGAQDLEDKTVWDIIDRLSQAENFVAYASGDGVFNFISRDQDTSTADYFFYGAGFINGEYGQNIKNISFFGPRFSKYYSRVQITYDSADTSTSVVTSQSAVGVSGSNKSWVLGYRSLDIENVWIADASIASNLADAIFNDVSALKREIEFSSSFTPTLEPLDLVRVSYDPSTAEAQSLWDSNNWADSSGAARPTDLVWDKSRGRSFYLNNEEFRVLSVSHDLDKLESKFVLRET